MATIKTKAKSRHILLLLILLPAALFAQKTKKVTEKHENPWSKEVYYVLKSDQLIKHGNYQKLGSYNQILINGYYKNGLQDSIWTEYGREGKTKKTIGAYSAGNKVGVWEFYDFKGILEQKYDYTKNEIVYFELDEYAKDRVFSILMGTDTIKAKLDRPPIYIGGSIMMFGASFDNLQYPEIAKEKGISGKVWVSFTVNSNGKTSSHRVTKGIGYGCDEEALKAVKAIPDAWIPAILNGEAVSVEFLLPILFTLN